ncbi:hypothetical protein VTN02DRAFT_3332 [Thermoascus thermophilus]
MAQPVRVVREQRIQLRPRARERRLGEVQRDLEPLALGRRERVPEDGDIAAGRVPAEVDAHDAAGAVADRQVDHLHGFGGAVAPVDGEDQVHRHAAALPTLGRAEFVDAVQDGRDILLLGDVEVRDRAGRRAELEVADPVVTEVVQDRAGGVAQAGEVVAELVDGFGEHLEEAVVV